MAGKKMPTKAEFAKMSKAEQKKFEDAYSKGILITDPIPGKQTPKKGTSKKK